MSTEGLGGPVVFVHIPKAAGTSFERVLLDALPGAATLRFTGSPREWIEFVNADQAWRDSFDVLSGHAHFGVQDHLSRPAILVTIVRDPVERIVSLYAFARQEPGHHLHWIASQLTLAEFARAGVATELDNDQTRWLCRRPHAAVPIGGVTHEMACEAMWNLEHAFACVGLTERADESAACLRVVLGKAGAAPMPRANVTRRRPAVSSLDAQTLSVLRECCVHDLTVYERARAVFEEQCGRLGVTRAETGGRRERGGAEFSRVLSGSTLTA
jgi:hypothetical protein